MVWSGMSVSPGIYIISLILILSLLVVICTLVDISYSHEYYESKKEINNIVKDNNKSLQTWLLDDNYSVIVEEDNENDAI